MECSKQIRENSFRKTPPSDYDYTIMKTAEKKKKKIKAVVVRRSTARSPKEISNRASYSGTDAETTRLHYLFERIKPHGGSDCKGEDIPKADVVIKWNYELGKSLVPPDVVSFLPTQM